MQLATVQDAEAALGVTLPAEDQLRMGRLLRQSSSLVLGYARMPEPAIGDQIPATLVDVTVEIALRTFQSRATPGARRESTGPYSVDWSDSAAQGGPYLTDADRVALSPYRRSAVSVRLESDRFMS
jgi:hypothetical protein